MQKSIDALEKKCLSELSQINSQLLLKEPFWGHLLSRIDKKTDKEISSIQISIIESRQFQIKVNPIFWTKDIDSICKKRELSSIVFKTQLLKKQILSIIFHHIERFSHFQDELYFSYAQEIQMAAFLDSTYFISREIQSIFSNQIQIDATYSIDTYYQQVEQYLGKKNKANLTPKETLILEDKIDKKSGSQLSELEKKLLRIQSDHLIQQATQWVGKNAIQSYSPQLWRALESLHAVSIKPISWKKKLSIFTQSVGSTRLKNTLRKPSKRHGTFPGIQIRRKTKILCIIDSSASITEEELLLFYTEIKKIQQLNIQIQIAEADTVIQQIYQFNGKIPKRIKGWGGTDYTEVLKEANQQTVDAILFFTDGYSSCQLEEKLVHPLLWVLSPEGMSLDQIDHFPGQKIKMSY